jgi:ADP-dependent NAD(P)H-hydrate dehydratase / NAD(P)H-hydrate epimerase
MAFHQSSLPQFSPVSDNLYPAEQVRELDRRAIEEQKLPGITLMKRAGQAIFDHVFSVWPDINHLTIFCGAGNNGGDGYIVAGLAAREKIPVMLVEISADKVKGDAARARNFALELGVQPVLAEKWLKAPEFAQSSLIVDALLGTGFSGKLRRPFAELIHLINQSGFPVVSADIPSGLHANTGYVQDEAVYADSTVTFIGNKLGLYTGQGRACAGEIMFDDLGAPSDIYSGIEPLATKLSLAAELTALSPRRADAHKGQNGHLLIIGGDHGYAGAPLMAAEAAARMGAGLVSVATRAEHIAALVSARPEVMAFDAQSRRFEQILEKATTLIVGPGLGTAPWGQRLLQLALGSGKPMVLDADALNLIAQGMPKKPALNHASVITPHPGEAARLLGKKTSDINQNRIAAITALGNRYRATVLLKGSGTLIKGKTAMSLCPYGNPGMASGGMGDVLSGIIGGLMAQGLNAENSARLGSCLHAHAADLLAELDGQRGILATDLIDQARALLNGTD